jgi:hypothetical protein
MLESDVRECSAATVALDKAFFKKRSLHVISVLSAF